MKGEEILKALGEIDEKLIDEARPGNRPEKTDFFTLYDRSRALRLALVAAAFAILLTFNLTLSFRILNERKKPQPQPQSEMMQFLRTCLSDPTLEREDGACDEETLKKKLDEGNIVICVQKVSYTEDIKTYTNYVITGYTEKDDIAYFEGCISNIRNSEEQTGHFEYCKLTEVDEGCCSREWKKTITVPKV